MLERVERVAWADPYFLNVTSSQSQGKFKVTPWSAGIVRTREGTKQRGEGQ